MKSKSFLANTLLSRRSELIQQELTVTIKGSLCANPGHELSVYQFISAIDSTKVDRQFDISTDVPVN